MALEYGHYALGGNVIVSRMGDNLLVIWGQCDKNKRTTKSRRRMKPADLGKPFIPVAYGLLVLEVAEQHGLPRAELLRQCGVDPAILDNPDGRLSMLQAGAMLYQAMSQTGYPAIGYEIGLHSHLTSHGIMGYGLLSSASLREAIDLGAKFIQLRLPNLSVQLIQEGSVGAVEVRETLPLGPIRQCMIDLFLAGLARMAPALANRQIDAQELEMWFDYPEPDYYESYRARLPRARFNMGVNQLRFPAAYLDRRLETANPVTAKLVTEQCDRELAELGLKGDLTGQVRAILRYADGQIPDLKAVAERLCMSTRTLKRKLSEHGVTYKSLTEELRSSESKRLLKESTLSMERIATKLGYSEPANFTRAFRKWTGMTPTAFREQSRQR